MKLVKLAAAVVNQTPLDWNGNKANLLAAIGAAKDAGASVLCLPELSICGYGCEDAFQSRNTQLVSLQVLEEILPATTGLVVSVGLPYLHEGTLYNCAALLVDGELAGLVAKQNLAGEGIHYEPRWFKPWQPGRIEIVEVAGQQIPLGDLIFDCGGVTLGFEICEDAWVAHRPGSRLAAERVDIILNPSASHFAFGKQEVRRRFVLEGSRAFNVSYVYANLLGNEAGRAIYDGGTLIASGGRMLTEGPRFSFADWHVETAVVDIDATRLARSKMAETDPVATEQRPTTVAVEVEFAEAPPEAPGDGLPDWEQSDSLKEEEFARAVSLGLFDYLRKSRSRGFGVSLSGGADSATVATLVALAVRFGIDEIGKDRLLQKLVHIEALQSTDDVSALVGKLLTCVYQSTRNSGETTRTAASELSQALGATFYELDVDGIVTQYKDIVAKALGRELSWETDDIALQNIQARSRAPSVWMIANIQGALLLSTSNRSEAAVGYATMDGDTSGGLAPIAGIDKAFLRQWIEWMRSQGPAGIGSIPVLERITAQQPTAELRPPEMKQTDEDDLMPYLVLDAIERAAIRDKHAPIDVFKLMTVQFPDYTRQQMGMWVERFFQLWTRNQWKRERYAPSFHLDDENLDPKTWCRFPILSGGFVRELADLRALIEQDQGS